MSKHFIVIGSAALEIDIASGAAAATAPCGRMLSVSLALADAGRNPAFVSEAARDRVGDLLVDTLGARGVDTSSIDRYVGGHTPLDVTFLPASGEPTPDDTVHYRLYPQGEFDAIWPRVSQGDIVVIGDYFAVARRNARFVREFVANARQSRAIIIYAPGFKIHAGKQLTPVKPTLLDTLEWADFVWATQAEMAEFFGAASLDAAYRNNIAFYCPNFMGADTNAITLYGPQVKATATLTTPADVASPRVQARMIAALATAVADADISRVELAEGLTTDRRQQIAHATAQILS